MPMIVEPRSGLPGWNAEPSEEFIDAKNSDCMNSPLGTTMPFRPLSR